AVACGQRLGVLHQVHAVQRAGLQLAQEDVSVFEHAGFAGVWRTTSLHYFSSRRTGGASGTSSAAAARVTVPSWSMLMSAASPLPPSAPSLPSDFSAKPVTAPAASLIGSYTKALPQGSSGTVFCGKRPATSSSFSGHAPVSA